MTDRRPPESRPKPPRASREERLAAALRVNLARRKARARVLAAAAGEPASARPRTGSAPDPD
jgi:hypothetical protein